MTKKEQLESLADYWYDFNRDIVFILTGVDIDDLEDNNDRITIIENGNIQTFCFDGDEVSFMTVEQNRVFISIPEKLMENKEIAFYLEKTISEFEL